MVYTVPNPHGTNYARFPSTLQQQYKNGIRSYSVTVLKYLIPLLNSWLQNWKRSDLKARSQRNRSCKGLRGGSSRQGSLAWQWNKLSSQDKVPKTILIVMSGSCVALSTGF